jgi:hypothetical protein
MGEGEIIVGITERSIFGITWNYLELFLEFLENLHKIPNGNFFGELTNFGYLTILTNHLWCEFLVII